MFDQMTDRVGVSESTISRLEKGDDGVSIGTLAMACLVLGEIGRISDFLDAGSDRTGLLLEKESLPKRIDRKRESRSAVSTKGENTLPGDGDDDEGVGF